ncbi:TPA: DNA-binding response regulator [Vibrio vulnificus]|uniref:response regulator transcription factor n=1 Tax=Vibrio sp. 05-20-BW147 TaxID=2575834 RepID=UPI0015938A7C|nr:response regulator transcription factor [Vibrio sp. 05-20-BW147]NVC64126.1 response regulator transcription factor [Vibrio sp. 05-20-BW147]HAS6349650.1 DNA-binding response regulator [Vibrio vulnificus]
MRKSSYARKPFFISLQNEQTPDFIEKLSKKIEMEIPTITPATLMQADPNHRNRILLIDYQQHKALLKEIKNLPLIWKSFEIVLLNVPNRLTTEELVSFGQCKAIFYRDSGLEKMAEGICSVINGKNWLPRDVSAQLLHYYRNMVSSHTSPVNVDLTIREIQVLRCVQSGKSNTQIAEDLFISEFTVKSHLYQTFRKLSVKNRVQAAAWADQNLIS